MRAVLIALSAAAALGLIGCGKKPAKTPTTAPAPGGTAAANADASQPGADASKPKATYAFAAGLEAKHPEIVGFLRDFLETCLAKDYAGYRQRVSRRVDPESQARFDRLRDALKALYVDSIEPIESSELPQPCYLVIARAELIDDPRMARQRAKHNRPLGVLVMWEEDEWRLAFAPRELQPDPTTEPTDSSPAPTTDPNAWYQGGDS